MLPARLADFVPRLLPDFCGDANTLADMLNL